MEIRFVKKRIVISDKVSSKKQRGRRAKDVQVFKKKLATDIPPGYQSARKWQTRPHNLPSLQPIRSNDSNGGISLGDINHLFQALRKYPVVRKYNLSVLTGRRNPAQSTIEIRNCAHKLGIVFDSDP